MIIFLASLFVAASAHAHMVVYDLRGNQAIAELSVGGKVTPEAQIIWDELRDGKITETVLACIGGLSRDGRAIICDSAKMRQINEEKESRLREKIAKETRAKELKEKLQKSDLSSGELSELIRAGM